MKLYTCTSVESGLYFIYCWITKLFSRIIITVNERNIGMPLNCFELVKHFPCSNDSSVYLKCQRFIKVANYLHGYSWFSVTRLTEAMLLRDHLLVCQMEEIHVLSEHFHILDISLRSERRLNNSGRSLVFLVIDRSVITKNHATSIFSWTHL